MNLSEIKRQIIAPTLKEIGLYSDTALDLVTGTGLVESGFRVTVQSGGGPALGWFQMEPATHDDCWANYLRYRPELAHAVSSLCHDEKPSASLLQSNPAYAAAMCRVKYLRVPAPLPSPSDSIALCQYWKQHYNTVAGAGQVDSTHIAMFQQAIVA